MLEAELGFSPKGMVQGRLAGLLRGCVGSFKRALAGGLSAEELAVTADTRVPDQLSSKLTVASRSADSMASSLPGLLPPVSLRRICPLPAPSLGSPSQPSLESFQAPGSRHDCLGAQPSVPRVWSSGQLQLHRDCRPLGCYVKMCQLRALRSTPAPSTCPPLPLSSPCLHPLSCPGLRCSSAGSLPTRQLCVRALGSCHGSCHSVSLL